MMSDERDQQSEVDVWLVLLRKLQRPSQSPSTIAGAKEVSKRIQTMINKGAAKEIHLQIREQLEERLDQLRRAAK